MTILKIKIATYIGNIALNEPHSPYKGIIGKKDYI